jgi:iron complex outermembrane receptor protein
MMKHTGKSCCLLALALATLVGPGLPTTGWAQTMDSIVVTTRKQEENLQSVPIAVQAFDAEQIVGLGLYDIEDIARYSPSLQFDSNFGPLDNRITIRGLSQTRGRPSAAILIDGIDVTSESVSFSGTGALLTQRLLDVERIEVVKGPQTTLYGRSAFNGAVQYITRDPSMDGLDLRVAADAGEFGRYSITGAASGPLIGDQLALGVNASWWSEDGFYEHPATSQDVGGGDGWGLATTMLYRPSDTLKLRGRLAYAEDDFDSQAQTTIRHNQELLLTDPANGVADGCTGGVFGGSACGGRIYPILKGSMGDASGRAVSTSLDPRTGEVYPGTTREFARASLLIEWSPDWGTLSSWTGFTDGEDAFFIDGDFDALLVGPVGAQTDESARAQEFDFHEDIQQFSQEIRYASKLDGPVNFSAGALFWHEEYKQIDNSRISDTLAAFGVVPVAPAAAAFPLFESRPTRFEREIDHWSVYASIDWQMTDRWRATLEGRYTDEETSVTGPFALPLGACVDNFGFACTAPSFPDVADLLNFFSGAPLDTGFIRANPQGYLTDSASGDFFTPKLTVEYTASDSTLVYGSIAKGIKPGGISSVTAGSYFDADADGTADEYRFDEEKLWVYELGVKASLLDGRLITNAAAFYQDYTDKQVSSRGFASENSAFETGLIRNAGEAEILGLELEAYWQATDNLFLSAGYTWLDTEYTDYVIDTTSAIGALRAGNCTVQADPVSGTPECLVSRTGNEIERTPEHSLVFGGRYQRPLGIAGLDWFVGGDGIYQGERYIDESNTKKLDSYWLANIRLGVATGKWSLMVYVNNVFDDDTIRSGVDAGGFVDATLTPGSFAGTFSPADVLVATLPDPRHWGLRFSYGFSTGQ